MGAAQTAHAQKPPVPLTKSTTFRGGTLRLPDTHENGDGGALVVKGDNLSVDFGGRVLEGSAPSTLPDARKGTGLFVVGKNITIKNVRVRGYKIGLFAQNAPGLRIINSDFSYNWKQHLRSTTEREDLADWMSFHHNEQNEWLRYGAGIYLDKCPNFSVQNCRATGGQNGLLLARSNFGQAINNDFSFLSGVGMGLYRSSDNRVMYNKLDWCVRGYSHGVYNRGQDSAAILAFEQCSRNTFAYNSATHGGDGFFLWAGQTTMDTGQGGCNDNSIYGNDFSHSPTNGVEVTFSRNTIANNLLLECWHGVWGGYSCDTQITNNYFGLNAVGVAIEHGQNNTIAGNYFQGDHIGISLWQNKTQDPNWAYPKTRDTRSTNYRILSNTFAGPIQEGVRVHDTTAAQITGNTFHSGNWSVTTEGAVDGIDISGNFIFDIIAEWRESPRADTSSPSAQVHTRNFFRLDHNIQVMPPTVGASGTPLLATEHDPASYQARFHTKWDAFAKENGNAIAPPLPVAGAQEAFLKPGTLRGRRYILVNEWGPYDFRSPLLWPREAVPDKSNTQTFEILGPPGVWKAKTVEGATLSAQTGTVPGLVSVTYGGAAQTAQVRIQLEYTGAQTTDFRGITTPAHTPVPFGYSRFFAPIAWTVKWFRWDARAAGNTPEGWPTVEAVSGLANGKKEPIAQTTADRLDLAGGGAFWKGLPTDHYATVANGTFRVPPGDYVLEATTDDGCFVWVDDKPVITTAWKYQGPTPYSAPLTLSAGDHTIRVCHFQIDGYAALQIKLRPR